MPKHKNTGHDSSLRFAVLAADTALFTVHERKLWVRLIDIDRPPYFVDVKGLPGGLVSPQETAETAALRHLKEKTHLSIDQIYVEQLYTFSRLDRDPRGRVVAVGYLALVPWDELSPEDRALGEGSEWALLADARKLAYDHDEMLAVALARLRSRVTYTTLLSKLMPKEFTLTELEETYEAVLGTSIDKRNFRKKLAKLDILADTGHMKTGGKHRPAKLYKFRSKKVEEIEVL